jgi:diphthamide biosynthesis methyltransferase
MWQNDRYFTCSKLGAVAKAEVVWRRDYPCLQSGRLTRIAERFSRAIKFARRAFLERGDPSPCGEL